METGVALQAELAAFAPHQQHVVGATMRIVAGNATLHFHRGMLEDKRPALLHMALDAGFPRWIVQAGEVLRAVGIVAVRTLHQSFGNPMVVGQSKLRLNGQVAGEAKRRFGLLEQTVVKPAGVVGKAWQLKEIGLRIRQIAFAAVLYGVHQVSGVALIAREAVAGVFRVRKKVLLFAGDMAAKAGRGILFWRAPKREKPKTLEGLGRRGVVAVRGLDRIRVGFRRTVAGLATDDVVLAGENQFRVTGLRILDSFALVAVPAALRTRKVTGGCAKLRRPAGDRRSLRGLGSFLSEACGCSAT